MQVYRTKHKIQEKCRCIFHITWLGGPNVGKPDIANCGSLYLPDFGMIENHFIFKEVVKYLEDYLVKPRKRLRTIIAEDENGFIVLKTLEGKK